MRKPLVACRESEPQSPLSSPHVCTQNGKLDLAGATLPIESAPPKDAAVQAAQSYLQQVRKSSSQQLDGRRGHPRTLLEMLQVQTQEPPGFAPTQHRKSIGVVDSSDLPAEIESTMSPGQGNIDLDASPSGFSLDDSVTSPRESMFSPPAELEGTISPPRSNIDSETPSEFSLDDSDNGPPEHMCSPPMVSGSDRLLQENDGIVQGAQISLESVRQGEENEKLGQDGVSKSEFEWAAVMRRSGRSLDSIPQDSFKTSRSPGMWSTGSTYSLSDEAISERAAAWGNGVARLVLKNSSRETTPRTSTASSVDGGLQYRKKLPGVSTHVKDALSSVQLAFVVCDVIDPEKPVLFASAGFFSMTGYSAEEVIGRNCRFLQGVDTDATEVARMSSALKKGEAYSGTILNYKKNGSPFWNLLTLSPITDDNGVTIKYMGMQAEVKSNPTTARRPKKTAVDTNFSDIPRSVSQSIMEEMSQPLSPPSRRSKREGNVPIFTLPSSSRVTATEDANGRSQGSKRYSLTYGTHGRRRSVESLPGRPIIGGSERYSVPPERKRSLAPQQRPSKTNSARPFYWLLTAARIVEEEMQQVGFKQNKERSETITRHEERKGGCKNKNKISRVAKGVFGLFRKLERKVFKLTSRAPMSSNRINAYNSESDVETDDFVDIGNIDDIYFERHNARCESMPRINSTRRGSASNLAMQGDLRARSNRYFPSAALDRSERTSYPSNINEFVLDRKQFCIVDE